MHREGRSGWPVTCPSAGGGIGDASSGRHFVDRVRRLHSRADTSRGRDGPADPCPGPDPPCDRIAQCASRDHGPAARRAGPEPRAAAHHSAARDDDSDPEYCASSDPVGATVRHRPGRHSARRAASHFTAAGAPDKPSGPADRPLIPFFGRVPEEIARAASAPCGTVVRIE